ncbi:MAG: hypothetical protein AAF846_29855 [Chloroflexota bacterium]
MPKRKRKQKPKRKSDPVVMVQQVSGCLRALFRVIALFVLWICLIGIGVLIYLTMLFPAFDPTVWIAITGLFAYLSSYFAFGGNDEGEDEKPKNEDLNDD